ncbi:MAG: 50S ribosomal protein L7/L12 [uncultured bacterium]|nr:MAG: 50S ribosomal protein L7/L12 [uncultured bacterium]
MTHVQNNDSNDADRSHKIDSLREMILNAEKTIQGAKAMLLQLEGKKKTGRKRKLNLDNTDGEIVEGIFDGQIMIGNNGKQYPVPANYASKSKLIEGDMLKLTITDDGSFVYKQIGPAARKTTIGIVSQDEKGNYFVFSEGKPFKVLLASITYFKIQPGDEVAILTPREIESNWAAIENVLQKTNSSNFSSTAPLSNPKYPIDQEIDLWKKESSSESEDQKNVSIEEKNDAPEDKTSAIEDEWTSDISEIEKEIKSQQSSF